jgi:hypothetical protein
MRTFGIILGVFGVILLAFGNDWGLIGLSAPLIISIIKDINN